MLPLSRRRVVAGLPAALLVPTLAVAQSPAGDASPKVYYSDYFSFVGRDDNGFVYLAHDNNRGRTGDQYFADHWIAMFDAATGWIDVQGSAHYPNPEKALDWIPPSDHFRFTGKPETGMTMIGDSNAMHMTVDPLPRTLYRENADGIFWVGGAPAMLKWKGRTLKGRVLFEYLQRHNWNRFTADFGRNWQNFNGLYLLTDSEHDFYVHYHERQGGSDLTGKLVGLASWASPAPVGDLVFRITHSVDVDYRTYRWPDRWQVDFTHAGKSWRLDLVTEHRRLVADWETGGFAMSVVKGTIAAADGSRRFAVVGWGELLI
jgi:hypothetical protein